MDLNGVDSNGVSQQVIDALEAWREELQEETSRMNRSILSFHMAVNHRDAEYSVACLQVLLQQERIAQRTILSLFHDDISDEAVDVFGGFLRETPCRLQAIYFRHLPRRQFRRLLASLHTNRSVKELGIQSPQDNEGASWIADLLRHKTDFMAIGFYDCRFPFTQIFPMLHGQSNLKELAFITCRINTNELFLFHDPETTQLFVGNILLSPSSTLQKLHVTDCGDITENRPLMTAIHQNTSIVDLLYDGHAFLTTISQRNIYLGHVHVMLGTRTTTTLPGAANVGDLILVPTIPPPCGLWPTVLAKVGQGNQGATPVFTILRDRLPTWMAPSPRLENQNELEPRAVSPVAATAADSETIPSGVVCASSGSTVGTKTQHSPLRKKRVASTSDTDSSKKSKGL